MVEEDEKSACLLADRLIGRQNVVVKPLPAYIKNFGNINGISGCTLLGDGSISLILNVSGLMESKQSQTVSLSESKNRLKDFSLLPHLKYVEKPYGAVGPYGCHMELTEYKNVRRLQGKSVCRCL